MPDVWSSITAGLQVPVIPFVDAVGNVGGVLPAQRAKLVPKLNVGVTIGFTVTANVVVAKHWPGTAVGVKV